jgi:hypothetical protein
MLKSSWVFVVLIAIGLTCGGPATAQAGIADAEGVWQFNDNFDNDLAGTPSVLENRGPFSEFYVNSTINGQTARVLDVPAFPDATQSLQLTTNSPPNAGGGFINNWTLVYDILFKGPSDFGNGDFPSLLNTNGNNANDQDVFIRGSNAGIDIGDATVGAGAFAIENWYRLGVTAAGDQLAGTLTTTAYLNGEPLGSTSGNTFDGGMSLDPIVHLIADENGDTWPTLVNSIGYWDETLSSADMLALGGTTAAGINVTVGPVVLELTIDRDTGATTLSNNSSSAITITGYDIDSPTGAWDRTGWLSIAENYDADSGGSVDPDDAWLELGDSGSHNLGEGSLGEATINVGQSIDLGPTWVKNFREDATFGYLAPDGTVTNGALTFTGNGGEAWQFLDLNFDGAVDINDWLTFKTNSSADLTGLSAAQGYALSDLDGDGTHDLDDFSTFQQGYDAANGAGAFAAMTAAVPEPSTMALAVLGLSGLMLAGRRRSGKNHGDKTRRLPVRHLSIWLLCGIVGGCLLLANSASAGVFLWEDFEGLPLGPNVEEGVVGDEVWTNVPPDGWVKDDTGVPGFDNPPDNNGVTEWIGWTFPDKDWWIAAAGNQNRVEFTKGFGTVMVADPDEWDDATHPGSAPDNTYDPYIDTPPIDISGVGANELKLMFDSSWRPEFDSWYQQSGNITISYDGGAATEILRWVSDPASPDYHPDTINEWNETVLLTNLNNPEGASSAVLTWGMFDAGNDWWWAVDNISLFTGTEEPIVASVNRANGEITLETGSRFVDVNGYEITSESGSLNPSAWATTNLEAQAVDAVDGGDDPGETWEALNGDDQQLWEGFLLGSTLFSGTRTASLGRGYDAGVGGEDLEIRLATISGQVLTIPADAITYFGEPILNELGDVNLDGDVNGLDVDPFVGLVTSGTFQNEGDMNQDGVVNGLDVDPFVEAVVGGSAQAVPEPSTLALLGLAGLGLVVTRIRKGAVRMKRFPMGLSLLAVVAATICLVGQPAFGTVTVDRQYLFGDIMSGPQDENATAGGIVGANARGETLDTVSKDNNLGAADAQNLVPNSTTAGAVYVQVGTGSLQRPGTAATDLAAQFDGVDDNVRGQSFNSPFETAGPGAYGSHEFEPFPILANYPRNYNDIHGRGMQFWVRPDGSKQGQRQDIVMDTNEQGVYITANDTWGFVFDNDDIDSGVPVEFDQWQHVFHTTLDGRTNAAMWVDGVAVASSTEVYDDDDGPAAFRVGSSIDGSANFFKGVVDNVEVFVYGDNTGDTGSGPSGPGQDWGTLDVFADNEFIAAALEGYVDGDMNGDGLVNDTDLALFQDGWKFEQVPAGIGGMPIADLETRLHGDFNVDGIVDLNDWHILRTLHTAGGGAVTAAVPEPSTALLAALAGLLCLAAARRRG